MTLKRRKPLNPIGGTGRLSEARLSKQLGGRLTPASGAMLGAKGDIDLGSVLMEAKSTISETMALKFDWLSKISQEARNVGKTPALAVSFVNQQGKPWMDGDWVMLPRHVFKEILDGHGVQESE
jgi:hypothetical protein